MTLNYRNYIVFSVKLLANNFSFTDSMLCNSKFKISQECCSDIGDYLQTSNSKWHPQVRNLVYFQTELRK
jgi:hypothetical protein